MKLTNQTYLPPITPSSQPTAPDNSAPLTSGNGQQTADRSKIVYGSNAGNGGGVEYPTASNERVGGSGASGAKASGFFKLKSKPKPKPNPKPDPIPTPKEGSPGAKNSLKNMQDINDLHEKNGFKPLSSELAASARNALINGGANLLVSIPMSVAEHVASKAIINRIEGQARMPGAEKKDADGKITTVDPAATEQQKIDARLEDSEIKTELMANQILSINEGPEAKAVSKKADASKDTAERLTNQEKTLDSIEKQIEDLSERYDIVHKRYKPENSSDTPTDKSRMDNIAKHYTHLNKTLMRLINAAQADAQTKAQADAEADA